MKRRQVLKLGCAALATAGSRRPAVCRADRRSAISAGVLARRLRLPQSARALLEQLLLRVSAHDRNRASRCGLEHRRTRADRRLGARTGGARHHRLPLPRAPGRLRPVCRHGRFVAQPLRDTGQHRARTTLGRRARLPLRFSRQAGGDLAGSTAAPIAFTDALPLAFEGSATVPNLSLKNVGKPPFDERQAKILDDMYADHHLRTAYARASICARKWRRRWPRR
jgi:hypothetical protein